MVDDKARVKTKLLHGQMSDYYTLVPEPLLYYKIS